MPSSATSQTSHSPISDILRSSAELKRKSTEHKSQITSFRATSKSSANQVSILDAFSQSKRQKVEHLASCDINNTSMYNETPTMTGQHRSGLMHAPRFQPRTDIKKLIIKNRKIPPPIPENYYEDIFLELKHALQAILSSRRPQQPLEKLYCNVEDMCRSGQAERLFLRLLEQCRMHLEQGPVKVMLGSVAGGTTGSTLQTMLTTWQAWTQQIMQIRSIFGFLDRSFLLGSKSHPRLNDMAIALFRDALFGNTEVASTVYREVCDEVHHDRTRQQASNSGSLKESITMLHILDLYKSGLEPELLSRSNAFFQEFATINTDQGLKYYIARCADLFQRESLRCDSYNFDSATKRVLLADARLVLINARTSQMLDISGIEQLLTSRDIESLANLYSLLSSSNVQSQLRLPWEQYIRKTGSGIISDPSQNDQMVVRLLELKKSLDIIVRDAFGRDETFKFSMREAYSGFMNDRKNSTAWAGNSLVGEVIAKYIDSLLRGGLKAVPRSLAFDATERSEAEKKGHSSTGDEDAELDRQLEQGVELFRFIEGKDVFEAFYKKDLARRLLMARSASQDAERNMLTKLKSECGSNFTHNLEQMFKDQELSRDEMVSYKQSLSNTSKTSLDLQVSVLSAAAWPTYLDVKINLPDEVGRHIEKFDRHYKHKHTGRRLTWKHALAHSIVKASFAKGDKELIVSGFQAIVLVLFNDIASDGNLSYTDIREACGLVDAELQRTLQSLACTKLRVLNKHPKGRDVNETDTFTLNLSFSDPKFRIKINQIQLKETKEENKDTHERVAADRQYETQAAIVRVMKSRKTITHPNLVSEVINQTKSRGAVEPAEIKRNIEKLIEKDYIERDGSAYNYLA